MSIFGQVWLWSIAAFLVGVLLTWLLLVRPARARNRVLERRLLAAQTTPAPGRAAAPPTRTYEPYEPTSESRTERVRPQLEPEFELPAERIRPQLEPEPEPVEEQPEPAWYERESFGEPITEHTEPEPVEEAPKSTLFDPSTPPATEFVGLSSVLEPEREPEREPEAETTSIFRPVQEPETERGSLFDPEPPSTFAPFADPDPEPEPPAYAFGGDEAPQQVEAESAAETTQVLPRRQPRQSQLGGFEAPQPIQPSMRAIERREPVQPDEGGRSGSLFEPAVRPNSAGGAHAAPPEPAPAPPPARRHAADSSSQPPGPFGPGSAMPRPGGGRPSEDFAVKASVTALRYCTEDSPQFSRMVAEVWFRSAADAERVGFRPLT